MNLMMQIIRDLTPLNRVFCSSDYDRSIDYLMGILPFQVISYTSHQEHNGWMIPPKWDVKDAKIFKDGRLIYDGTQSALGVIALSKRFEGRVDLEELKRHLHFDHRSDDAIPFHFRQQYRSWERDWGFCVPKRLVDQLSAGTYEVVIETEEAPGTLKLLEVTHRGALDQTIVFMAHLDHPGTANDGLSGCALGVELFRRLMKKKTRFSYRLFLHQEVIGSEYYLGLMPGHERERMVEGLFLEMLGSSSPLALQSSYRADGNLERSLERVLSGRGTRHRRGGYGDVVVNGEYVWQAYGIPVASLSRFPFPEYHTDKDNFSLMSAEALDEALEVVLGAIDAMEASPVVSKLFQGTLCLSNPKFDLYEDPGQPAFGYEGDDRAKRLRLLMDLLPTLARPVAVAELADRVGLSKGAVEEYLKRWVAKGLLSIG